MKRLFAKIGVGLLACMLSLFLLTGCTEDEVEQFITIVFSENNSVQNEDPAEEKVSSEVSEAEGFWVDSFDDDPEDEFFEGELVSSDGEDAFDNEVSYGTESEDSKPNNGDLNDPEGPGAHLDQYGTYTSMEDVSEYLQYYGELPENFITKKEAEELGWTGGSLEQYAPGMCIGGDRFGNYEKLLPTKKGRVYYECDIDTLGADKRGAKRIVYSNDGLIYYTEDHYESFLLLYGTE